MLLVLGCSREKVVTLEDISGEVQTVEVIGPAPIQFEAITGNTPVTKGTSVQNGSALLFGWEVGDTLGIFPNLGNQVEFPITAAQGSTSASFDGGGWALRNDASYAAYYPFSVWNYHRDNETILLDYTGQVQEGNGSFAHLSAYDFLASDKTTSQNSSVTFQMTRQGAILYIDIVVPEPESITSLTIACDDAIFVEKAALDISGETPAVSPISTVKSLTLSFINTETTTNNETVRAYMAVQPVDFTEKTVTATLTTESGSYTAPVTSRAVNKGRAAFLRFSDDFTPVNIEFADPEVKRICVENWDTDGDGELSYKEAAAVTDLGQVFTYNKIITTFDELEYFTGLTEIPVSAFMLSTLESVMIPKNVQIISHRAFDSSNIESIVLPETITTLGNRAFSVCESLRHIEIPDNVDTIGDGAFYACDNLESFSGKYSSSDGNSLIIEGALIAIAPAGLTVYEVPHDVSIIKKEAIHGGNKTELKMITIPEGVTVIEDSAIQGCSGITDVTLPNSLFSLGENNFTWYCSNLRQFSGRFASNDGRALICNGTLISIAPFGLTEYAVPNEVTAIGSYAFYALNIPSINLPDSLEKIGYMAFACFHCDEIVVPANVTSIESYAFHQCHAQTLKLYSTNPCTLGMGALGFWEDCPIYVPNESVEAYKAAPGWSEYADRIFGIDVEGIVVGPDPVNPN